jgi:hypothetical protein
MHFEKIGTPKTFIFKPRNYGNDKFIIWDYLLLNPEKCVQNYKEKIESLKNFDSIDSIITQKNEDLSIYYKKPNSNKVLFCSLDLFTICKTVFDENNSLSQVENFLTKKI